MTVKEFLNVCDKHQNLILICDETATGFIRCRADLVGGFYTNREIKRIYAKTNGKDIEIAIEVE